MKAAKISVLVGLARRTGIILTSTVPAEPWQTLQFEELRRFKKPATNVLCSLNERFLACIEDPAIAAVDANKVGSRIQSQFCPVLIT